MKQALLIIALVFSVQAVVPQSQAQLRKANRALDRGEYEEAMTLAQELLAKKPDDHKTWDLLARIHDSQASQSLAEGYLMHVQEMVEAYNRVVELRPREGEQVNNRMQIFYRQTFYQGIEEFGNAQSVTDDDSLQAEHFRNSARYFQASSIVSPDSAGAYMNWAYALIGAGDTQDAIKPLKLAIEYGGPDYEVYSYLSRIYLTTPGQVQDAIPVLEEASRIYPDSSELQDFLLNAYGQTGQNDRALEKYAESVQNYPKNKIYRYNYGSLLLQNEQYDEAIEQLEMAVQLDPEYTDAFYNWGAAYINKANLVQAQISALDDDMRARRDDLSEEEEQFIQDEIDLLIEERRGLYWDSILPLEEARNLAEMEEGRSVQEICAALFQAYAQTGQEDLAMSVSECAEMVF